MKPNNLFFSILSVQKSAYIFYLFIINSIMEYFAALKAKLSSNNNNSNTSSGNVSAKRTNEPATPSSPYDNLVKYWNSIQSTYINDKVINKSVTHTDIPVCLEHILNLVIHEDRISTPQQSPTSNAIEYFLFEQDIIGKLARWSESDTPRGFRGHVIRFFNNFLTLVAHPIHYLILPEIHLALMELLYTEMNKNGLEGKEPQYVEELLELTLNLSRICVTWEKNQQNPDELHWTDLFFIDPTRDTIHPLQEEMDFVFITLPIRYMHFEGLVGDYARACLLEWITYTFSPSSSSETIDLQKFIFNSSGFIDLLVSSFGGLWNQLPIRYQEFDSISQQRHLRRREDSIPSIHDHQAKVLENVYVESFLKLYEFLNQICLFLSQSNLDFGKTFLDHLLQSFQTLFLNSIVRAKVLDSLEYDGSSFFVTLYLNQMVLITNCEPLASVLVGFVLQDDVTSNTDEMTLSMKDVVLCRLNSLSQDINISTLLLLTSLLERHSNIALPLLFPCLKSIPEVMVIPPEIESRSINRYISLLILLSDQNNDNNNNTDNDTREFQEYLRDVEARFRERFPQPLHDPILPKPLRDSSRTPSPTRTDFQFRDRNELEVLKPFRSLSMLSDDELVNGNSVDDNEVNDKDTGPKVALPGQLKMGSEGTLLVLDTTANAYSPTQTSPVLSPFSDSSAVSPITPTSTTTTLPKVPPTDILTQLSPLLKDPTLYKITHKFSQFFQHSPKLNLALSGLMSALAMSGNTALITFLFAGDLVFNKEHDTTFFIFTVLKRLLKEVEAAKLCYGAKELGMEMDSVFLFEERLAQCRDALFSGVSIAATRSVSSHSLKSLSAAMKGDDEEDERNDDHDATQNDVSNVPTDNKFFRNIVVLEEIVKELVAIVKVRRIISN